MTYRTGRRNPHAIYAGAGLEPTDDDTFIGSTRTEQMASDLVRLANLGAALAKCAACGGSGVCRRCTGDGCGTEPGSDAETFGCCTDGICTACKGSGLAAADGTTTPQAPDEAETLRGILDHALANWSVPPPFSSSAAVVLSDWDDAEWADSGWTKAEQAELRAAIDRVRVVATPATEDPDG